MNDEVERLFGMHDGGRLDGRQSLQESFGLGAGAMSTRADASQS